MRRLGLMLKGLVYLIAFLISTVVMTRLTFDPERLRPEVEQLLGSYTGAQVKVAGIELAGALGLSISSVELAFPMPPEREAEWVEYRAYLKAKRLAKRGEGEEPEAMKAPRPALKLCAQNLQVALSLSEALTLLTQRELSGSLEGKLFDCEAPTGPLSAETPQRISVAFKTALDAPEPELSVAGKPGRRAKREREIFFRAQLNPLDLKYNELVVEYAPMSIGGELSLEVEGTVTLGRRGQPMLRKSSGNSFNGTRLARNDALHAHLPWTRRGTRAGKRGDARRRSPSGSSRPSSASSKRPTSSSERIFGRERPWRGLSRMAVGSSARSPSANRNR